MSEKSKVLTNGKYDQGGKLSPTEFKFGVRYSTPRRPATYPGPDKYFDTLEELCMDRSACLASTGHSHRRASQHYIEVYVCGHMVELFEVT
jgi:hypothetical protein